ncbi:MAG: hypothetical protein KA368_01735 [Acidobacteria bacterium]|nr:hypothetical protein [Acidobacteriota bacterium]
MKADAWYRLLATLANSLLFAYILNLKAEAYPNSLITSAGMTVRIVIILFCAIAYFVLFYFAVRDTKKNAKVFVPPRTNNEAQAAFDIKDILISLERCKLEDELRIEIKNRLDDSIDLFGKEETLKNLVAQHKICVENERFYEQIAWQIGAFFVPISLTLGALSQTPQLLRPNIAVVSGCTLFLTWFFLFGRFRTNIRLYRDCAKLIEEMIGFFALTYVYEFCFERYGNVVRVWPFLITLSGLYFNYMIYAVL